MNTNDGGPAFPNNDQNGCAFAGMTLRDWMAGMALQLMQHNVTCSPLEIAEDSYLMADAMLSAREVNQTETN